MDQEAPADGRVHLLLDESSLCVLLVFACGEAVNAANPLGNLGQVHDLLKTEGKSLREEMWEAACVVSVRVHSTDRGTVPVLQEQSQQEAGLGEDAAALLGHLVAGLLSVLLHQIQQNSHRVLHRVHGLDGLVVLVRDKRRGKVTVRNRRSSKTIRLPGFCLQTSKQTLNIRRTDLKKDVSALADFMGQKRN